MIKVLALLLLMLACSCSTILNSRVQKIEIVTYPNGATVLVNNKEMGKTPIKIILKKGQDYYISINKAGYEPFGFKTQKEISTSYYLNFHPTIFGLWGSLLDLSNGTAYNILPYEVEAYLIETKVTK